MAIGIFNMFYMPYFYSYHFNNGSYFKRNQQKCTQFVAKVRVSRAFFQMWKLETVFNNFSISPFIDGHKLK